MEFHLVGDQRRIDERIGVTHHLSGVVGNSDVPGMATASCFLKQLQGLCYIAADQGPMQQQDVDIIGPDVFQARFDRGHEFGFGKMVRIDLCGQAQLAASDTGAGECFTNFGFVLIHLRRINGPVADLEGRGQRFG